MSDRIVISELEELSTVESGIDWVPVVDVSDKSASIEGTTKKAVVDQFIGPKGDAATVDVGTTTTGNAGTDASVINSGTTSAAVLDFTIPRGDKGDKGDKGVAGKDGLDITWRGVYSAETAYVVNDAVSYSGSSYICKLASTGNLPTNTTYWDLMAQKGVDGEGSGDVRGPESSTDNAIARFHEGTGKIIQNSLVTIDDSGSINIPAGQQYLVNGSPVSGYSDEQAQDAVGGILTDTTTIDLTYTDETPSITADIKDGSVSNAKLSNMATKTYKGRTSGTTGAPEDVPVATLKEDLALVKGDVGLGNVDNVQQMPLSYLDTDGALTANSDTKVASQKAVKTYVDSKGFTWKGAWATSTSYSVNDIVKSNGSGYVCTSAHTSDSTTEPGVGANWTTVWDLFVEGTDKTMPAGDVVGTTDTQTLTNKTIDGDDNTLSDISPSSIKGGLDGWIPMNATCTYVGADDPTYTMYVSGEAQTFLSVGMKFECFQSGMKFFFITAIGAYDSGNDRTLVTLYGGTDYDLANAEIGLPAYSMVKSPYGFPMSPAKWSVELEDTTNRTQTNPSQNVWYNIGSLSLTIPIGVWNVFYNVCGYVVGTNVTSQNMKSTLSTANNSESDATWTSYIWCSGASGGLGLMGLMSKEGVLTITEKDVYYLNGMKPGATASDNIGFYNLLNKQEQ